MWFSLCEFGDLKQNIISFYLWY